MDNIIIPWERLVFVFVVVVLFQVVVARFGLEQESKRRWQHALTGHILVQVSYILPIDISIVALFVGAIGIVYVRFVHIQLYLKLFGPLLRPEEIPPKANNQQQQQQSSSLSFPSSLYLPGAFYFLLGTAMTAYLFPLDIARYAVECLSFADPMAAFIGKSIPSYPVHKQASLAGSIACFGTCCILGYIMLASYGRILVGALACTVSECLSSVIYINDNMLIPIMTAAAVYYYN